MIEFRKAVKSFGDKHVLKGVDLSIREGETFVILGKTGAGKSVLIRSLVGLVKLDSGEVFVDGQDVTDLDERGFAPVRLKCGMVFQLPTLLDSFNVFENVAFGLRRHRKMTEAEIEKAVKGDLELVGLDPAISELMPTELSYGQAKRVGLARTVALRPRYLLYDEPTTGLDPLSAAGIDSLINHMAEALNVTSIVITHDVACMRAVADRVALLHEGLLIETDTPEEFERSQNPIARSFIRGEAAEVTGGAN